MAKGIKQTNVISRAIHRRFRPLKKLVFSRILVIIFLLLLQLFVLFILAFKFSNLWNYYIAFNGIISLFYSFYLVNMPGKNEFKLAWLVPVFILPVFGIILFFLFKVNIGGRRLSKNLFKIKRQSNYFFADELEESAALEQYPKIHDIAAYLKDSGGFTTYTNTKTDYFSSGESAFSSILQDLKNAEHFIFVEFFVIEDSFMWNSILSILTQKAESGIKVYVMYDSLGSVRLATRRYEKYLRSKGINAKIFSKFIPVYDTALNNRDHRKLINVDGKIAWTGGVNISDEYINKIHPRFKYWKDSLIRIEGPAVRTFTVSFLQLWFLQQEKTSFTHDDFASFVNLPKDYADSKILEKGSGIIIPYGDDAYTNEDIAENVYNYIVSKSHDYIHIMTPYLIIDNTMLNSLIFAAKRNVKITIIVPKQYDHFLTFCVGRRFILQLIKNGIRVFEYNPGFIHSKIFVSDDKRATVGSVNLDYRSLFHHFECGTFLYSSPTVLDIEMDFQATLKDCSEITLAEYKKIPLAIRLTGWFFKIFAPLL